MDCDTRCTICGTGTATVCAMNDDGRQILCDNDLCGCRTSIYYGDDKQEKAWNEWHGSQTCLPEVSSPPVNTTINDSGYVVFSDTDLVELIEIVNKAIIEGWVCCGGFSASTHGFYQAMIRDVSDSN